MNLFIYGDKKDVALVSAMLDDDVAVFTAAELCPSDHALSYSFTKKYSPRMRNTLAAQYCHAVVICRRQEYWHAVVNAFKARGRRTLWFNGLTLVEVAPIFDGKSKYASPSPEAATPEWELWAEQVKAKRDLADQFRPFDYGYLGGLIWSYMSGCARCTALLSMFCREEVDAIPPCRNWSERCDDLDCSEEDVLHPSHQLP